jgi:hypothetical protein
MYTPCADARPAKQVALRLSLLAEELPLYLPVFSGMEPYGKPAAGSWSKQEHLAYLVTIARQYLASLEAGAHTGSPEGFGERMANPSPWLSWAPARLVIEWSRLNQRLAALLTGDVCTGGCNSASAPPLPASEAYPFAQAYLQEVEYHLAVVLSCAW